MASRVRVTLDDPALRHNLRRYPLASAYTRRPIERVRPRLIDDIVPAKPQAKPSVELAKTSASRNVARQHLPNAAPALPRTARSELLMRKAVKRPNAKPATRKNKLQYALVAAAVVMLAGGGYLSFIGWHANRTAVAQAKNLTRQANSGGAQNLKALSTVKPTAAELSNYVVAPDLPRYLNIPAIGVHARVLSVGITSTGALGTPNNIYDTAWYNESAEPGASGAMLIDGHLDGYDAAGVFWNLHELVKGDAIQIVRGDGKTFNYKVVKTEAESTNAVNMSAAMTPINPSKPGLNLITCDGDYVPGSGYNKRTIVFAELN